MSFRIRRLVGVGAAVAAATAIGPAVGALASTPSPGSSAACSVSPGSWPEYQGDPTHAGDACSGIDRSNVASLKPAWFVATNGAVTDTPAVSWGSVFAGDYTGIVRAVGEKSGQVEWTFNTVAAQNCFLDAADPHADTHAAGFGEIPASPAAATIKGEHILYVAAGGSLFALDASNGSCLWAQDTDPNKPGDSIEIESSPVVDQSTNPPEVLVGNDDNSGAGVSVTGLMAFNAQTGALLWRYEPERDVTLTPAEFGGSDALTLSCGDGTPDTFCDPASIPGLAPNTTAYADACGDVWSSPALDTRYVDPAGRNSFEGSGAGPSHAWSPRTITATGSPSGDGLVVFGTGNCAANPNPAAALAHGDYVDNQSVFALDPVTGVRVWNYVAPYDQYDANANEPGGGDDDFGSSPIIAHLASSTVPASACRQDSTSPAQTTLVIEGSKNGTAYGICEATGAKVWANQVAQPGQLSGDLVGAVGGLLGSPSMGMSGGKPTVFFTSSVFTPFSNDGVREPGDGDSNISSCPGLPADPTGLAPLPPACPDTTVISNPQRLTSLHAVDAATGAVDYQAASLPTYAASSYTGGVVFLPDSLAAGVLAFNSDTGQPLWAFPLGAVPASQAAIAGNSIYLGTGETDSSAAGETLPPQATGIWGFTLASS